MLSFYPSFPYFTPTSWEYRLMMTEFGHESRIGVSGKLAGAQLGHWVLDNNSTPSEVNVN